MADTVDEVDALSDVPAAIARYLDAVGLVRRAIAWKTLEGMAWRTAGR